MTSQRQRRDGCAPALELEKVPYSSMTSSQYRSGIARSYRSRRAGTAPYYSMACADAATEYRTADLTGVEVNAVRHRMLHALITDPVRTKRQARILTLAPGRRLFPRPAAGLDRRRARAHFRPPQPSRCPVTRALAAHTTFLAAGSSCNPLSEFRRTWWRPGDFRGAFLLFELCGLVPDARSASQSLDGRLLFAAELSMRLVGSGAVGRVEASD